MAVYYWVGGSGTWDDTSTANWSASSGGAAGAGPPNNADSVNFDVNSGTAATVTVAASAVAANTTINKADINLSLSGSPTLAVAAGTLQFTAGTITLNDNTLTVGRIASAGSGSRTIAFGVGKIVATGNNNSVVSITGITNMSFTGTPTFDLTYSGSVGTRSVINNTFPESQAPNVNVTAGTDVLSFSSGSGSNYGSINFNGFSGTFGVSSTAAFNVFGDLFISSGMSFGATLPSNLIFAATSGTKELTSNGKTFDFPVSKNGIGGGLELQDSLTMGTTRTFTLNAGTLDLKTNTLSCGLFSSSNSGVRTIAFGTGNITITGNNNIIWQTNTLTNLTITGTPIVNLTYSGAIGTRTVQAGVQTEANSFIYNVTAGTDTFSPTTSSSHAIKSLDLTGFNGTLTAIGCTFYGNLTLSSGITMGTNNNPYTFAATSGTQTITSAGKTINQPITQNNPGAVFELQDNLTMAAGRTFTLTAGTLDLTGNSGNWTLSSGLFASSNSNTRVIRFGTGNITVTGSGTVWDTGTLTGLTYTGTPTVNVSNNSATATTVTTGAWPESTSLNFNYTVGTYTLTDTNAVYKNVNFTGFTGTVGNAARTIYGNLIIAAGSTLTAGANATTFAATSGTQQITTNGITLDFPLTFNGIGGTFAFQDALTQGSARAITLTNGTLQLKNGVTSTVGAFATSGTNQKFLQSTSAGNQATISQASGTVNVSYLTIQDSNATGGAAWNAYVNQQNIDAGNNDGWDFGLSPVVGAYEYTYSLRSFTQPKRF